MTKIHYSCSQSQCNSGTTCAYVREGFSNCTTAQVKNNHQTPLVAISTGHSSRHYLPVVSTPESEGGLRYFAGLMTLPLTSNWDEPIEITARAQNSLTAKAWRVTRSTLMRSRVTLLGFSPPTMTAEHKSDNETLSLRQRTPEVSVLVRKEYANEDLDPNQIPEPVC